MRYINTLNGFVLESDFEINGKYWQLYDEKEKQDEAKEIQEPDMDEVVDEIEETENFDLTKLTVAELKKYAKENDIDIPSDLKKKDEIIQAISESFVG